MSAAYHARGVVSCFFGDGRPAEHRWTALHVGLMALGGSPRFEARQRTSSTHPRAPHKTSCTHGSSKKLNSVVAEQQHTYATACALVFSPGSLIVNTFYVWYAHVQVAPSKFSGDALDVLTAQIEAKFADRVIANVGLCICLHSYESIGDPYVYPSDGAAHYKVRYWGGGGLSVLCVGLQHAFCLSMDARCTRTPTRMSARLDRTYFSGQRCRSGMQYATNAFPYIASSVNCLFGRRSVHRPFSVVLTVQIYRFTFLFVFALDRFLLLRVRVSPSNGPLASPRLEGTVPDAGVQAVRGGDPGREGLLLQQAGHQGGP